MSVRSRFSEGLVRCALLLSAATLLQGAVAPGGEEPRQGLEAGVEELLRSGQEADRLTVELVQLGPQAVPALLGALFAPAGGDADAAHSAEALRCAREALSQLPHSAVRDGVELWLERGLDSVARLTCLELLGELGRGKDLDLLCAVAFPAREQHPGARVRKVFESSLTQILARDPKSLGGRGFHVRSVPAPLRTAAARAAGRGDTQQALEVLEDLLGLDDGLDGVVLRELHHVLERRPELADEGLRRTIAESLDAWEGGTLNEGILVVAQLGDGEAAPRLIELLDHPSVSTRDHALSALRAVTGVSLPASSAPWRSWWEGELGWWRDSAPEHLESLRGGETSAASRALLALAEHPVFRRRFALGVAWAIATREDEISSLACSVALQLRLVEAVSALIDRLQGTRGAGREAAGRALRGITGRDLPADAEVWTDALRFG